MIQCSNANQQLHRCQDYLLPSFSTYICLSSGLAERKTCRHEACHTQSTTAMERLTSCPFQLRLTLQAATRVSVGAQSIAADGSHNQQQAQHMEGKRRAHRAHTRAWQARTYLCVGWVRLLGVSPGEQWLSPLSQKQTCMTRLQSGLASRPSRWLAAIWSLLYTTPNNTKSGHFRG